MFGAKTSVSRFCIRPFLHLLLEQLPSSLPQRSTNTMSGVSMRDLRACMVCSIVQRFSVRLPSSSPSSLAPFSPYHPPHPYPRNNNTTHITTTNNTPPNIPLLSGLPRPRLSELRAHPRPRQPPRNDPRLHLPRFRGTDHHGPAHTVLGCQMAETRGVCAGGVCGQGGGCVAEGDCERDGGRWGQVYSEGWDGSG